ncbi:MAG: DUF4397 domain-containing protein [Actinobacteria bacterium]|nr:DUF4397 domain-containing protein [Actinomycetota bacterium]
MRRLSVIVMILVVGAGTIGAATGASRKGTVTIVHGLPGFTADVYLDDELLLDGFAPTTATDPLRLDPGAYDLALRDLGAPADSEPVLSDTLSVSAGSDLSVVVHLTQGGTETVSTFENSFGQVPAGGSLLVVRDVAAAPSFWVRVDGRQRIQNLRSGNERAVQLEPGPHLLALEAVGSGEKLIPPSRIRLDEGVVQIVYVIGEESAGNLDLMLQSVANLRSRPTGVLTGVGGLAAERDAFPAWATLSMIIAGSGLLLSAMAFRPRRHD